MTLANNSDSEYEELGYNHQLELIQNKKKHSKFSKFIIFKNTRRKLYF